MAGLDIIRLKGPAPLTLTTTFTPSELFGSHFSKLGALSAKHRRLKKRDALSFDSIR
jgi:hypothetical protein